MPEDTLLDAFDALVARQPDRPLLWYFDTPVTAVGLDRAADALAVALQGLGVARGDRVALLLQNQPQYVVALLATWRLGAIVVPCSPLLRAEEIRDELRDAGAKAVVALEALYASSVAPILEQTPVEVVLTTSELDLLDQALPGPLRSATRARPEGTLDVVALLREHDGERPVRAQVGPADPAVLSYTSGTTGPAKGAQNTHGGLRHNTGVWVDRVRLGDDDVAIAMAPLFHVTGLVGHVGVALANGVPLVLAHRFDADETCRLVEARRATFAVATLTAYSALLQCAGGATADLGSLVKAYCGGAPISPASAAAWQARTGATLHTAYGLTEATGPTHLTPLGRIPPVDPTSGALAVGLPVAGVAVRILDPAGDPVPPGTPGEIAVRGPQVVPGYWRRPEETASTFRDGELRTGDVGVVDAEGWLYVVDRLKDLIIASGFNVWPREVEDVLYEHPAVHGAAVLGVPDEYRGETVAAFVALKPGSTATSEELIAFTRGRLASYKYPRSVTIMDELPVSATGKILRKELRAAALTGRSGS